MIKKIQGSYPFETINLSKQVSYQRENEKTIEDIRLEIYQEIEKFRRGSK